MLDVTLLGTGGTMPLKGRRLASAVMRLNGKCLVIDCGEGTQVAFRECGYTFKPCGLLCFTHFHADHVSGLPGLLLSMGNEGRRDPLTVAGPHGIDRVVNSLRVIAPELPFEIRFIQLCEKTETFSSDGFNVTAFRVNHNIPCYGYSVSVPRAGKFDPEKAKKNGVPMKVWSALQKSPSVEYEGVTYTSDMILGAPRKGIKVTYCTDTRPCPSIAENAAGSDLFICEGMYGDDDKTDRAKESMHMTFSEACRLAAQAGASELWLTHYSPSLSDPDEYLPAARAIFPNTYTGFDGRTAAVKFADQG